MKQNNNKFDINFFDKTLQTKSKNITYIWKKLYNAIKDWDLFESEKIILIDWLEFKKEELQTDKSIYYWNKKLRILLSWILY